MLPAPSSSSSAISSACRSGERANACVLHAALVPLLVFVSRYSFNDVCVRARVCVCACVWVCPPQPWDRDNIKLFYQWLFTASGFIAAIIVPPFTAALSALFRYKRRNFALVWAPLLVILLTTSGMLSYIREQRSFAVLYGPEETAVCVPCVAVCGYVTAPMYCGVRRAFSCLVVRARVRVV